MALSPSGSVTGPGITTGKRTPGHRREQIPSLSERRKRRDAAVEDATRRLEKRSGELMESMINLALDQDQDPRARAAVGMKLINKILPDKPSGPLVQINNRNEMTLTSHLNLPTSAAQRETLNPGIIPKRLKDQVIEIDAATIQAPKRLSYHPSKETVETMPKQLEPLSSKPFDDKPDGNVSLAPEPREVQGDSGVPQKKVGW
jgi:hypothetical protein